MPSRWDKWNTDLALGFTPDADTLFELTAGTGDGEARGGRGMDGSKFKRESFGLRFEKRNLGATLEKIEAQLCYNYADHVMDNYKLRRPDPNGPMPMAMAANVDRATWGGRAATLKLADTDHDRRAGLPAEPTPWPQRHRHELIPQPVLGKGRRVQQRRPVLGADLARLRAWPPDRRSARRPRLGQDFRPTTGHMMMMPNPTAGERRDSTLPSGFLRYEQDLEKPAGHLVRGPGPCAALPDYWELFSPGMGPAGSVNAFDVIKPEKTTQLDVGMQYRGDKVDAWVSGYAGYVRDFILFDYRPGGMMGPTSQASSVNARIAGGELGASWKVAPSWTLGATLAYAWGENRSDGRALPQIPPLEAKLSAAYDDGVWSAGALWRLVAQKRYALNSGNVVGQDFGPSAGFGVFSLNAGYAISKQVKLSLGVDNLFDKAYAEHLNLAGDAGFGFPATRGSMNLAAACGRGSASSTETPARAPFVALTGILPQRRKSWLIRRRRTEVLPIEDRSVPRGASLPD